MSGRINVGRPRLQQGVPDFPGDKLAWTRMLVPCGFCGLYLGRCACVFVEFEESRAILLATPREDEP